MYVDMKEKKPRFPRGITLLIASLLLISSVMLFLQASGYVSAAYTSELRLYDFIQMAEDAYWETGTPTEGETIEFGGPDTDPKGFAMYKSNVKLNDGETYSRILETHPRWQPDGWIKGTYSNIYIPEGGATLHGKVGFISGGTAGSVKIKIWLSWSGGAEKIYLRIFDLDYSDGVRTFEAGVPGAALGHTCNFHIKVEAGESSGQDWVAWAELYMTGRYKMGVELDEDHLTILQGGSETVTIHVTGDYEGTVNLYLSNLPSGVSFWFDPSSGTPPFDSTLTLTVSEDADVGTFDMIVRASGRFISDSKTLTLTIAPFFTATTLTSTTTTTQTSPTTTTTETTTPSTTTVTETQTTTVTTTETTTSPQPTPTTTETTPTTTQPTTTTTETTTSPTTTTTQPTTEVQPTTTQTSPTTTTTETPTTTTAPPPFDFSLSASQTSLVLKTGEEATIIITVTLSSGEPKQVSLSVIGLPDSVTYNLNPPTLTPTASATLKLSAGAQPGTYNFIVQAEGDGKVKTLPITLKVEKESRCLIATAAFGSELAAPVQALREFRDGFVMETFAGENFMEAFNGFYYSWSPYVAEAERENPALRNVVRVTIYPLLFSLKVSRDVAQPLSSAPELAVLTSGILASFLIGLIYLSPILLAAAIISRRMDRESGPSPLYPVLLMLLGLSLFFIAEVAASASLMTLASSMVVLTSISIGALTPLMAAKLIAKRG